MKLAIIGSRDLIVRNIMKYIPDDVEELISGGARGIDTCVAEYAKANGIKLVEFLPEYSRYGRAAPLKRNEEIANYADGAVVFWDSSSKGTKYTIDKFIKMGKPVKIVILDKDNKFSIT